MMTLVTSSSEENFDPPPPRVVPAEAESSADEDEAELLETPPMSDPEEAEDRKMQMMVDVFDYHSKARMFSDRVALTQTVGHLKALMYEFENTSEEDKGNLVLCSPYGVVLNEQDEIGMAMRVYEVSFLLHPCERA